VVPARVALVAVANIPEDPVAFAGASPIGGLTQRASEVVEPTGQRRESHLAATVTVKPSPGGSRRSGQAASPNPMASARDGPNRAAVLGAEPCATKQPLPMLAAGMLARTNCSSGRDQIFAA